MLSRFASGVSVASPVVALATVIALFVAEVPLEVLSRLTSLWCIVPAVWGLWAMLAPRTWVPERLPLWGAILGLLVGTVVLFALNLPPGLLESPPPTPLRALAVLILVSVYYLLWLVVRKVFGALARQNRVTQ